MFTGKNICTECWRIKYSQRYAGRKEKTVDILVGEALKKLIRAVEKLDTVKLGEECSLLKIIDIRHEVDACYNALQSAIKTLNI